MYPENFGNSCVIYRRGSSLSFVKEMEFILHDNELFREKMLKNPLFDIVVIKLPQRMVCVFVI